MAASFATFAALPLEDAGFAGGQVLVGLMFMLILVTVVVQSFTTPWLARVLGVQPMLSMIIGADAIGRQLAQYQNADGEEADETADQEVREVVENRALVGKPLRTIPLNRHVLVVVLRRDGTSIIPDGATMLALGDAIMGIGARDAVNAVAAQCISGGRPRMDLDRDASAGGPYADDVDR